MSRGDSWRCSPSSAGRWRATTAVAARVIATATRRHGYRYGGRKVEASSTLQFLGDALSKSRAAARQRRLVVVETTTLDIARGEPATSHIRAALAGGAHVITANKGPVAFAYRALARAAARADRRFLFEGAVMDGVPIFNLVRETLPAVTVAGFRGVVNSTTNFILTAMEQGQPFEAALAEMQARGIAEADPSLDVDGWDAAAKTAALANVLLDARITPHEVDATGPHGGDQATCSRGEGGGPPAEAGGAGPAGGTQGRGERAAAKSCRRRICWPASKDSRTRSCWRPICSKRSRSCSAAAGLTQTAYALVSDLVTIARATRATASVSAGTS